MAGGKNVGNQRVASLTVEESYNKDQEAGREGPEGPPGAWCMVSSAQIVQ